MDEEKDLDTIILEQVENEFKTVRRICEDLIAIGIEIEPIRIDARMRSLRKFNMVEFQVLDFPIVGPKPIAYKKKPYK